MIKGLCILSLIIATLQAFPQENNLYISSPMGWNSWNWFGKNKINEKVTMQCIDAIVEEGLRDLGYKYVVIDGGWRDKKLGPGNELVPHPVKFPNGIKVIADYAHSKGLKLGLHTVPGTHDCGGDAVGGFGNEEIHMEQFVAWGIDFIKLDKCIHANGWEHEIFKQTYLKWHNLIKNSGRKIIFSISARHPDNEWQDWFPEIAQIARTTDDIMAKVSGGAIFDSIPHRSVIPIAEENSRWADHAGNGYWNDPDFLAIGNQGLTSEEQKVHFALWCIMSAPLILGNDPRNMSPEEKKLITNKLAIAINQDPTEQGNRIKKKGNKEVWVKNLKDGNVAVLLFNRGNKKRERLTVTFDDLKMNTPDSILNVYTKEAVKPKGRKFSHKVEPHAGMFLLFTN